MLALLNHLAHQNHDFDGSVEMFEELAADCHFPWCATHPKRVAWLRSCVLLLRCVAMVRLHGKALLPRSSALMCC